MRITPRALVVVATASLVAAGFAGAPAQAVVITNAHAAIVDAMDDTQTAGAYVDRVSGRVIVTVTNEAAAAQVRAKGGTAKVVKHSAAALNQIVTSLDPGIAGTAWSVDAATNQVV
ncbi:MAG TPA: serine protease, partial [Micromonosporaceae bacterium]|nr:serine protease [Micromonosporaceae bacterium]